MSKTCITVGNKEYHLIYTPNGQSGCSMCELTECKKADTDFGICDILGYDNQYFKLANMYVDKNKIEDININIKLESILELCFNAYEVNIKDEKSNSRFHPYSFARHLYAYLARKVCKNKRWREIGELVGRNHSTMIASVNTFKSLLETGDEYAVNAYEYVCAELLKIAKNK